jgi:hypothetical protein
MTYETASAGRRPAGLRQRPGDGPVLPPVHQARAAAAPRAAETGGIGLDDEVSGIGPAERIARFLAGQGIDVDQAVRDLGYAREHAGRRTAARAEQLKATARTLKRARRELELELDGYRAGRPGYTAASVAAKHTEVTELVAALMEGCGNDARTAAAVRASVAV